MKTIVIGAGEIGISLYKILSKQYESDLLDKGDVSDLDPDIIHICFPYSKTFVREVRKYQKKYNPKYTVIHSTVKPGTSCKLGAIHSPIIGLHPNLEKSLETFTKYIGGDKGVAQYFRRAGFRVYLTDKPETTEVIKILSTSFYGLCVEYTKEVKRVCEDYNVPFEMWTLWNDNYNKGYEKLGYPEYKKPNLVPMQHKIKGHCILPNLEFIKSKFHDLIKKLNGSNRNT